jgi:alkyldihydroxyacetonephosphate synthase
MTREMQWSGWGDPAEAPALSPATLELLRGALSVRRPGPTVPVQDVRLPPVRLGDRERDKLAAVVGAEHLSVDDRARLLHTRGKSTKDLLRIRSGEADDAPDAVVFPGSHEEVLELLSVCGDAGIAVVPFGGGTSVVGGLEPRRAGFSAVVALDLGRMNRLLDFDEKSRTATLEPGLRGPEAEALLAERGYTIGHYPQSFQYASIGGFAAARSSGQASAGYGRFDERVVALRIATPKGTIDLGRAPKSAAGPDLRQLFLGSEGTLGVITALRVEVSPLPEVRVYEGWRFETFAAGCTAARRLAQDGPLPTVLRLSDEAETAVNLARPTQLGESAGVAEGRAGNGALAIAGYEGTAQDVQCRRDGASAVIRALGAERDPEAGAEWFDGRYKGPYLRDALLDAGALVETLETVTFWSGIERVYEAVRGSLQTALADLGTPPVVLCHISHVYRSGACLYFTIGAAQLDDPVSQWNIAKAAASDAILAAGGSITHHHGVGIDHREHYGREVGPLAVDALRAVKATFDPAGILNPGVLIG